MLYGTDLLALDDIQDPEVLVSEDLNVAYALARRLLRNPEDLEAIGETSPVDCIDVRDWLGNRFGLTDHSVIDDLQTQVQQVMLGDPRVQTARARVTYAQGTLSIQVQGIGANGPFQFVLAVNGVTTTLLRGG